MGRLWGGGAKGTLPPHSKAIGVGVGAAPPPPLPTHMFYKSLNFNVMQKIGTSASLIPARVLSVKMVGH